MSPQTTATSWVVALLQVRAFLGEHGGVNSKTIQCLGYFPGLSLAAQERVQPKIVEPVSPCIREMRMFAPAASGCRDPAAGGHRPPPPGAGRSCQGAASPEGARTPHLVAIRAGKLSLVGIFPCRAVNSVTGSEVSLPPCPAAVPRRPQLDPGGQPPHGSSLAPARRLPPCCWPGWGCGPPFLPAGLSRSSVTQGTSLARGWLYIARRDVCAGNVPAVGWGGTPGSSHRCPQGAG